MRCRESLGKAARDGGGGGGGGTNVMMSGGGREKKVREGTGEKQEDKTRGKALGERGGVCVSVCLCVCGGEGAQGNGRRPLGGLTPLLQERKWSQ